MSMLMQTMFALTCAAGGAVEVPELKYEKYTLPNGLQVILHEDHALPLVAVNVWYHVGSKNERPGRTGFAHLFEHMMFQGTEHFDNDYFVPLQKAGAKLNGSTSTDRTNYWETLPANYLDLALWMEADRMGFLLPAMSQKKLDNQRDVVKNERRQSYENRPYGLVHETIQAAMYPADHPYSWMTIGSMADVTAATRGDVADFFRRYYHPGNASLCIAGDFDPARAKALVAKYFGPLPTGPKVVRPAPAPAELKAEIRIRMTDRVGLARSYLMWHSVANYTPDDAALDVLAYILGGGKTSRLYRALVHEKQLAQDAEAFQQSQELTGEFGMQLTARPDHSLAELETAALAELKRLQDEAPSAAELAQAVNFYASMMIRGMEPLGDFGGRADRLNMYNVMTGDPGFLGKDFARYPAVTAADVQRVARKYLGPNRVVLEVTPGEKLSIAPDPRIVADETRKQMAAKGFPPAVAAAPAVQDTFDRKVMPGPGPQAKFQLPPIQRARLSNGLELALIEKRTLPVVSLNLICRGGRASDPSDKAGLAMLTSAVWDEGTQKRSSKQIADDLAAIGASLSIGLDWDYVPARLFTLKWQLGRALEIFGDVLANPTFPQEELERQRRQALDRLVQARNEPMFLAALAVHETLYGPEHPYGRPRYGAPGSLAAIGHDDLARFYRERLRPEQSTLIVVGDVGLEEIKAALEPTVGQWHNQGAAPPAAVIPAPEGAATGQMILIDKPGAAQSVVDMSALGVLRTTPDYFPLVVMNAMFGGQFTSRLNMNLREEKGYTYGARSMFDWLAAQPGVFTAIASVQTKVTAPAVVEFLKEFAGMTGKRPVTADELEFCKRYLTLAFPAGFETSGQLAGNLETLVVFHLPDDYFNRYVPGVSAVTAADVERVAKERLRTDRLVQVVVGDRGQVEAGLSKLGSGKTLKVYRFDDQFRLKPAGAAATIK